MKKLSEIKEKKRERERDHSFNRMFEIHYSQGSPRYLASGGLTLKILKIKGG
jgi:hypothetical protein